MNYKTVMKLMDVKTLVAGVIPVFLGSIYSWYSFNKINLIYFILLIIAIILVQSATNMINDYFDFKRGVDDENKEREKVLVSREVTLGQVRVFIIFNKIIAFIIATFIASQTSYYILLVVLFGFIISILYAFGPLPISYTPLGEVVSGLTMGIGITTTVTYIHSGIFNLNTVLLAVPTSIYIGNILLSNNLSDMKVDKKAGRKTLPLFLGRKNSERLWVFNVIMLFLLTLILLLLDLYPKSVLLVVILLFPYRSISNFLSYEKSIDTKERTMQIIGKIGLRYHLAVIIGLLISIIFE
ncbi:prenyltransferase [Sporohalobacter salinus]|uniref:prenyltransferase n=1 Tax=Sporohalobacter salinus TaxID=1494606 RepID=UPI001960494B|nr:prenyltransferase [Sporohalobacter salinus]MBM7624668.1 1,4-dihydroxy-2-naphthoate octaprenyltransferase [Sporohalobacter salinus]